MGKNYQVRIEELESRLEEAEELIEAIKSGEVDAFAFTNKDKHEVFTLQSGDFAYRILVENINEGAINLSEDGLIVYTNKSFCKLLELPYEKVIGNNIRNFIHPGSLQAFRNAFSTSLGGECTGEIELLAGAHTIPVYISLTSLRPSLDTVGMIITDLTEKKQAEKEIAIKETLQHQLEAQKIHETQKDEFLKMVSHELKTPVTSIKGYVQLMLAMLEEDHGAVANIVKKPLQRIENQVERLGKLITDILDISRLEDGRLDMNKEDFQLDELIKETVQDILFAVSSHSIIVKESFSCAVHADKNRIGQVLINLINNAIKYSPGQNKIEVSLSPTGDGHAAVCIKDYGIGIAQEEQKKVFQRFYQSGGHQNQNYTGFGIGLYISAEIIHRHGGQIGVASSKNEGSSFTFTIPLKK